MVLPEVYYLSLRQLRLVSESLRWCHHLNYRRSFLRLHYHPNSFAESKVKWAAKIDHYRTLSCQLSVMVLRCTKNIFSLCGYLHRMHRFFIIKVITSYLPQNRYNYSSLVRYMLFKYSYQYLPQLTAFPWN